MRVGCTVAVRLCRQQLEGRLRHRLPWPRGMRGQGTAHGVVHGYFTHVKLGCSREAVPYKDSVYWVRGCAGVGEIVGGQRTEVCGFGRRAAVGGLHGCDGVEAPHLQHAVY